MAAHYFHHHAARLITTLTLCILGASTAWADEASVKKAAQAFFGPDYRIESVRKLPIGLYELRNGDDIAYTDEKVSFVMFGDLIETQTRVNLTQQRLAQINAVNLKDLPLNLALKQVRGNGKRMLITFEDPNCSYCKRLARDMQGMTDLTLYTFILPVLGPSSQKRAEALWCATDRNKAWQDWMINNVAPDESKSCDTSALRQIASVASKYRIQGTPALIFANGERINGAVPVGQLEKMLNAIPK